MLPVSNYQYGGGGASPGDVMMEPDDVVSDEYFKSETWFQTMSALVSGFCHAQLPFLLA